MDNILSKIEEIAKIVFENETISIAESTGFDDIEEWDSLTQIQLIDTLEKEFNMKFSLDEMMNSSTIGNIANTIKSKIA